MKLRERVAGFLQAQRAGIESIFGVTFRHGFNSQTSEYSKLWLAGLESFYAGAQLTQPYAQHPVIRQAVETVAADLATIEWQAFPATGSPKDQATALDDHPVLDFLANPAVGMTGREMFEGSTILYLLDGEMYWLYPDVSINPAALPGYARLDQGQMILAPKAAVAWNTTRPGPPVMRLQQSGQELDPSKLTCFRFFNPYGPRGLSKIDSFFHEARADFGASKWNEWRFADRNGVPNLILKPPLTGGGNPADRDKLRERWESSFPESRRGIGILPPGWESEELGANPKDMEFGVLRDKARETILANIGLVPFLAGVLDKANYANAREQKTVYWRGTIARLLAVYQDKINNDFLPKLGVTDVKLYPRWELVRAMADDVAQKTDIATKWFDLGLSKKVINETLEMGWDPDDIPDYEETYLPVNLVPSDQLGDVSAPGAGAPMPGQDPLPGDDPNPQDARAAGIELAGRRLSLWRLSIVRLHALEVPFASIMRSWFHDLERRVLGKVHGVAGHQLVQRARARRENNVVPIQRAAEPEVDSVMFSVSEATRQLLNRTLPRIRAALISGGESALADAGTDVTFNPSDVRLAARLAEGQLRVRGISGTVRDQLATEISQGLDLGESADQIAERVRGVFDAAKSRSTTIARTEMGIAYSAGRFVGFRQAGITRHEWLTAHDDKVRPMHAAEDGHVVEVGTPFPVTNLLFPLDPAGPADEVINCRCTTLPVVSEVPA